MKDVIDILQSISLQLFEQFLPIFELEDGTVLIYSQNFHTSFILSKDESFGIYNLICYGNNDRKNIMSIYEEELKDSEIIKPRFVRFLDCSSETHNSINSICTKEYIERIKYLSENTKFKKVDKYQEFLYSCGTYDGVLFSIKGTDIYIKIKDSLVDMCVINKSSISYLKRQRILNMLTELVDIYIFG